MHEGRPKTAPQSADEPHLVIAGLTRNPQKLAFVQAMRGSRVKRGMTRGTCFQSEGRQRPPLQIARITLAKVLLLGYNDFVKGKEEHAGWSGHDTLRHLACSEKAD